MFATVNILLSSPTVYAVLFGLVQHPLAVVVSPVQHRDEVRFLPNSTICSLIERSWLQPIASVYQTNGLIRVATGGISPRSCCVYLN